MRAVLPGIVNDIVTSRTCGLEQADHMEENPEIDRLLLDHVMLAVELTLEAASNFSWNNNSHYGECSSDLSDSCSDNDDY